MGQAAKRKKLALEAAQRAGVPPGLAAIEWINKFLASINAGRIGAR